MEWHCCIHTHVNRNKSVFVRLWFSDIHRCGDDRKKSIICFFTLFSFFFATLPSSLLRLIPLLFLFLDPSSCLLFRPHFPSSPPPLSTALFNLLSSSISRTLAVLFLPHHRFPLSFILYPLSFFPHLSLSFYSSSSSFMPCLEGVQQQSK